MCVNNVTVAVCMNDVISMVVFTKVEVNDAVLRRNRFAKLVDSSRKQLQQKAA